MEEDHGRSFSWQKTQRRLGDLLQSEMVACLEYSHTPPDLQPAQAAHMSTFLVCFYGKFRRNHLVESDVVLLFSRFLPRLHFLLCGTSLFVFRLQSVHPLQRPITPQIKVKGARFLTLSV